MRSPGNWMIIEEFAREEIINFGNFVLNSRQFTLRESFFFSLTSFTPQVMYIVYN